MLIDADAGAFDTIVVHKLDRFARNLRVQLDGFDRLSKAGVGFVSLNENLDYSTPMGPMIMSQMGAWYQFYSDNLSQETKKGRGERKAQGLYNGLLPSGVTTDAAGVPVLESDARYCDIATKTETVPESGLVLAFQLAAAGKSDHEIGQALSRAGYRTSGNRGMNPFTKDTVRHFLQNRFYLGELPDGDGGWVPGKRSSTLGSSRRRKRPAQRTRGGRAARPVQASRGRSRGSRRARVARAWSRTAGRPGGEVCGATGGFRATAATGRRSTKTRSTGNSRPF
jgi:hypothetical protein